MGAFDKLKQLQKASQEERAERKAEYEAKTSSPAFIDGETRTFGEQNPEAQKLTEALVEKMNDAMRSLSAANINLEYTDKSGNTKPSKAVIKAEFATDRDGNQRYFPQRDEAGEIVRDANNKFVYDTSRPVYSVTAEIRANIENQPNHSLLVTLSAKSSLDENENITITAARASEFVKEAGAEKSEFVKSSNSISEIIQNYGDSGVAAAMKKMLKDGVIEPDYSHALENMQFRLNEQLRDIDNGTSMGYDWLKDENGEIVKDENGRAVPDQSKPKLIQDYYCNYRETAGEGDKVFKQIDIKSHSAQDVTFELKLSEETGKHFATAVIWDSENKTPDRYDLNSKDTLEVLAAAVYEATGGKNELNVEAVGVVAKYVNVEFDPAIAKQLLDNEKGNVTQEKTKTDVERNV